MADDKLMGGETVVLRLAFVPGRGGIHTLRAALKALLRRFGLRCMSIAMENEEQQ